MSADLSVDDGESARVRRARRAAEHEEKQRRAAIAVRLIDGSIGGKQQLHTCSLACCASLSQRCVAIAAQLIKGGIGGKET